MYRTVLRMVLVLALGHGSKTYASQRIWRGQQRDLPLPGGHHEKFYCNCWFYTPRCANVCRNYSTRYGDAGGSGPVQKQAKASGFNPDTMRRRGPGTVLDGRAGEVVRQGGVYPDYFPTRHLSIETIISRERLGKRAPYAQEPEDTARKVAPVVGMRGERAPVRSTPPVRPLAFSEKSNRNTKVEGDRRICDFLAWIHLAGANSADRRQRALLKSVLDHFFRSNNITEIVCEESGGLSARNQAGVHGGMYTLTKDPYADVLPQWADMRMVPSSFLGASAGAGASRVLYSKMYYTTTITPVTTILTSLEDGGTRSSAVEPKTNGQEDCISTMSKADIKQDALIVAGKVQERRSKIENMLSSARVGRERVEGMGPVASTRPKYRTTFVWKIITPYITREVLRYPQTAYYTTTELYTVTPLTTVFVDDSIGDADRRVSEPHIGLDSVGSHGPALGNTGRRVSEPYIGLDSVGSHGPALGNTGRRVSEPYIGLDSVGSHGSLPTQNYYAAPDDANLYEREDLATQYELAHAKKHRSTNTGTSSQDVPAEGAAPEQPRKQNNTDTAAEDRKGDEGSLPAVHGGAGSVVVTARELQKSSAAEKTSVAIRSVPESSSSTRIVTARELQKSSAAEKTSVAIRSVPESSSSTEYTQSLHSGSSLALSTSTSETVQSDSTRTLSLQLQELAQSTSREAESGASEGRSHSTAAYASTKTLVITTTMILDLERILEDRAKGVVRREGNSGREEGQSRGRVHGDSAHTIKAVVADGESSSRDVKKEDAGRKRTYSHSQAVTSVKQIMHDADEEPSPPIIVQPTTAAPEHRKQSQDAPVSISVPQISDTSSAARNMTSAITISSKSSLDGRGNTGPESGGDEAWKKTVTKVFTILTEGEGHSSYANMAASYTADGGERDVAAGTRPSKSETDLKWEHLPQESAHVSRHTRLMDIPLVSAIVREINAANLSKTVSVVTTTTTYCAEDRLSRMLERRLGVVLNKQMPAQHIRDRQESTAAGDAQAESSAPEKPGPGALLTIKDIVSSESMSAVRALKSTVPAQTNVVGVEHKSGTHTRLGGDSPEPSTSGQGGGSSASFTLSPKAGHTGGTAVSETASTFPIVKKVAIDDNFGVEIKVEPI